jgi:hypothetical protein
MTSSSYAYFRLDRFRVTMCTKAIFELGVPAAPDRAESAGDAVCDAAPPSSRMRMTAPTKAASAASAHICDGDDAYLASPLRSTPDEGLDLLAFERSIVGSRACRRGRTRRGGNGHASQRFTNELVLLVH